MLCLSLTCSLFLRGQSNSVLAAPIPSAPDTSIRRFELGGQIADIRTSCPNGNCIEPAFAVGPGATLNLNRFLAVDGELNITTAKGQEYSEIEGGRATEFMMGARAEMRARRYGFFLQAKPGFLHWSRTVEPQSFLPPYQLAFGTHNLFVSAVGAGAEYSPGGSIHFRTEVSDLIVRDASGVWSNQLQAGVGVYAGLGKPVSWQPPQYDPKLVHPFFDQPNLLLLSASTLAIAADGITTQRFIRRGYQEGDPIARPLVKYGWSGQVAASAVEITGELTAMYGFHRLHHAWIERSMPICIAAIHSYLAYRNTQFSLRSAHATQ